MNVMLVGAALAFAVVALILAAVMFFAARKQEDQEGVLSRLEGIAETEKATRIRYQEIKNPLIRGICQRLWQAGYEVEAGQVVMMLVILIAAAVILVLLAGLPLACLIIAVLIVASYMFLVQKAGSRKRKILEQMPEFLDYVLRALVAGNTLEEAFRNAAAESAEPARGLFMSIARQVRLGASLEDTLTQAGEINDIRDLQVLGLATRVNRRYGGSMRSVMRSMVTAIRQKDQAERELRALTAETRFSAFMLAIIPTGLSAFIFLKNPDFYVDMWANPGGRFALIAGIGLQIIGVFVIWRMMRSTETA